MCGCVAWCFMFAIVWGASFDVGGREGQGRMGAHLCCSLTVMGSPFSLHFHSTSTSTSTCDTDSGWFHSTCLPAADLFTAYCWFEICSAIINRVFVMLFSYLILGRRAIEDAWAGAILVVLRADGIEKRDPNETFEEMGGRFLMWSYYGAEECSQPCV